MDMGFKKEELLENLPDYINNKIDDTKLKEAIRLEILNNPDFRKEFDSISTILESMNSVEFTEPPINYFNNLLPKINERIYENTGKENIFKRFSYFWKYAVPVATIILFFIGYKTFFKNSEYINRINNDSEIVLKEYSYSDEKTADTSVNSDEKFISENPEYQENNTETTGDFKKSSNIQKSTERNKISKNEEQINSFIDFSENAAEEEILLNSDDMNYEQDFEKMSSEEQNDLLSKIKNSNL